MDEPEDAGDQRPGECRYDGVAAVARVITPVAMHWPYRGEAITPKTASKTMAQWVNQCQAASHITITEIKSSPMIGDAFWMTRRISLPHLMDWVLKIFETSSPFHGTNHQNLFHFLKTFFCRASTPSEVILLEVLC